MLYIAQRITEGGRLDSIRAVDALSVGRLFTPSALVDALFLDRLDALHSLPRDALSFGRLFTPSTLVDALFLDCLDALHSLPRDALSFGRSPTLCGRDGHCV